MIPLLQPSIDGLRTFLLEKNCFVSWNDPEIENKVREYIMSGKLIRGGLLVHLLNSTGKSNQDDVFILGAALELSQSAFLIQDDIMDKDEIRRGKPSLHIQLSQTSNTSDVGIYLALCIADYLLFMSQELLSTISHRSVIPSLSQYWNIQLKRVSIGQYHDIKYSRTPTIPSVKEIRTLYENKTSSYTFSIPILTSAITEDLPEKTKTILENIANDFGVLFQLTDDMLNMYGNSKSSGKPTLSDIREKKKTLLVSLAFETAEKAQQKILSEYYCNTTSKDMSSIINVFHSSEVKKMIDQSKDSLRTTIENNLSDSMTPKNIVSTITPLLDFIVTRTV